MKESQTSNPIMYRGHLRAVSKVRKGSRCRLNQGIMRDETEKKEREMSPEFLVFVFVKWMQNLGSR